LAKNLHQKESKLPISLQQFLSFTATYGVSAYEVSLRVSLCRWCCGDGKPQEV